MLAKIKLMTQRYFLFLEKPHPFALQFCLGYIFYAFLSMLILFLTQELSLSSYKSYGIMACFLGSDYLLRSISANLINSVISYPFAIYQGLMLNFVGITILFFVTAKTLLLLYFSLSLIAIGNSLLQPTIWIFISDLYKNNCLIYPTIYTKNQVLLNIGSILGPIISGIGCNIFNIRISFLSLLAFIFITLTGSSIFLFQIQPFIKSKKNKLVNYLLCVSIILSTTIILSLIYLENFSLQIMEPVGWIAITGIIICRFKNSNHENKNKHFLIHIFLINLICIIFFTIFTQINGSFILFVNTYISKKIYGLSIPNQWIFSLESIFVVLTAIFFKKFSTFYSIFEKLKTASKLSLAMLLLSTAFGILTIICSCYSVAQSKINILFILPFYFFVGLSELIFMPTILSYLSKAISSRPELSGLLISYFFISKGAGNYLSMTLAKAIFNTRVQTHQYLYYYILMFGLLTFFSVIFSLIILYAKFLPFPSVLNTIPQSSHTITE